MNKKIKFSILFILCLALTGTMLFFAADAMPKTEASEREMTASGTIGEVNWTLYADGELYVYGEGSMEDFSSYSNQPWHSYRSKISSINIDDGVTSIGKYGFASTAAKTVYVASSVAEIGQSAFNGCSYLENADLSYGVKSIGSSAFTSCSNLKSVTLPDSITEIGMYCFENCKTLESIAIPNNLYRIRDRMFSNCSALKEITFGSNTKYLSASAFSGCANLENVYYGGSLTDWCSIYFASELGNPLAYADNLYLNGELASSNLVLPDTITTVGSNTFYGASFLESVIFPSSIKTISSSAFQNCKNLKSVILSENLQSIDYYAFKSCNSLTEINIPKSVTEIKLEAFNNCSSLTEINVDPENTKYSSDEYGVLFNKDKTVLIQYPIGNKSTVYAVPETVEEIDNYAFYGSSNLVEIHIPETVTVIDTMAVRSCAVTDIYFGGSKADWLNAIGKGKYTGITIHYTLKNDSETVIINHTDENFDAESGNIHLEVTEITAASPTYDRNGYYNKNMINPIQVLDIILVDGEGNPIQPLSDQNITIKIKAPDEFKELLKTAVSDSGDYENVEAGNIDFCNGNFIFELNGETLTVPASEKFLKSFKIIHWFSDGTEPQDYEVFTYDKIKVTDGYIVLETNHFSEYAVCTKAVSFIFEGIELLNGETVTPSVIAEDGTEIIFTSSDENVITVDKNGVITAVNPGTATLTATISGTDISDTCEITVIARDFTVKWIVDGVITEQTVSEQTVITQPDTPEKEGYTFAGWTPSVPDTMPAENIEFTALWQVNQYTLTFNSAGGTAVAPITLDYGTEITPPDPPKLEGHIFKRWTPELPKTMPAHNITVTAVYEKAVITGIRIVSPPDKTQYTYKVDELDLSGIVIKIIYSDGSSKLITETSKIKAYGFSADSIGTRTITVEYAGYTAKFDVTVSYAWWQWIIRILLLGFIWY